MGLNMYLKAEFYIPTYDESLSEFKQNVAKPLQDLLKIEVFNLLLSY